MYDTPDAQDRAEATDADKFGGEDSDTRRRMPPEEPSAVTREVLGDEPEGDPPNTARDGDSAPAAQAEPDSESRLPPSEPPS